MLKLLENIQHSLQTGGPALGSVTRVAIEMVSVSHSGSGVLSGLTCDQHHTYRKKKRLQEQSEDREKSMSIFIVQLRSECFEWHYFYVATTLLA